MAVQVSHVLFQFIIIFAVGNFPPAFCYLSCAVMSSPTELQFILKKHIPRWATLAKEIPELRMVDISSTLEMKETTYFQAPGIWWESTQLVSSSSAKRKLSGNVPFYLPQLTSVQSDKNYG